MHMQRKRYIDMSIQKEMNTITHRQMKHTQTLTHLHIHTYIYTYKYTHVQTQSINQHTHNQIKTQKTQRIHLHRTHKT